jgi:hypothetical protein
MNKQPKESVNEYLYEKINSNENIIDKRYCIMGFSILFCHYLLSKGDKLEPAKKKRVKG